MADQNRRWFLDLIVIPIIVGVVVALVTFVLPKFMGDSKKLEYEVVGPIHPPGSEVFSNLKYTLYRVTIHNSGDLSLDSIPVSVLFKDVDSTFEILEVFHRTQPESEFGEIDEISRSNTQLRFAYPLLNVGDQDEVSIMVRGEQSVIPDVFIKAKDLEVVKSEHPLAKGTSNEFLPLLVGLAGVIASGLTLFIFFLTSLGPARLKFVEVAVALVENFYHGGLPFFFIPWSRQNRNVIDQLVSALDDGIDPASALAALSSRGFTVVEAVLEISEQHRLPDDWIPIIRKLKGDRLERTKRMLQKDIRKQLRIGKAKMEIRRASSLL